MTVALVVLQRTVVDAVTQILGMDTHERLETLVVTRTSKSSAHMLIISLNVRTVVDAIVESVGRDAVGTRTSHMSLRTGVVDESC